MTPEAGPYKVKVEERDRAPDNYAVTHSGTGFVVAGWREEYDADYCCKACNLAYRAGQADAAKPALAPADAPPKRNCWTCGNEACPVMESRRYCEARADQKYACKTYAFEAWTPRGVAR